MLKKFLGIMIVVLLIIVVSLFIYSKGISSNVTGSLEDIMTKVYQGINDEELPMGLGNVELADDTIESFVGTSNIPYQEAIANESMVGSIAHSVVLIRLENASDAELVVQEIKANVNPRKWICVEASKVIIKSKGDLVILIMGSDELAPKLEANFDDL